MTNITQSMQEELALALGWRCKGGLWEVYDDTDNVTIFAFFPDLIDLTNLFKRVVPFCEDRGWMWSLHVGKSITGVKGYWFDIWLTDLEEISRREKAKIPTRFDVSHKLPGHALFLAAWELLCKEEKE
uniref:Uncharacterized protein n=1 Tax=viral metagenome TaxID=1070528 RepID=A0A6M3KVJ6_9ZZZZ